MSDVIILGGGWSVSQYCIRDIEQQGFLISVNESAVLTKPHAALSMDRLWLEHRHKTLVIQGTPEVWMRDGAYKNILPPSHWRPFCFSQDYEDQVIEKREGKRTELKTVMTMQRGRLNGSNSGCVALNLAFQKQPRRVFLLGFDMCKGPAGESYWHTPYEWAPQGATKAAKYTEWAPEFDAIAQQFQKSRIEVFNVNHRSAIEAFKKISFEEFQRMTKRCSSPAV